jgi:hypothetical protein
MRNWGGNYTYRAGRLHFVSLRERLDPRGTFRNAWLERHVV